MRRAVVVGMAVTLSAGVACGSDDPERGGRPRVTTSPSPSSAPTDEPSSPRASASPSPEDDAIEVEVEEGRVETESEEVHVAAGDKVTIAIRADVADEVHVHGYDKFTDVAPGEVARLSFTADIPGQFEVELEAAELLLFELVVE